MVLVIIGLIVGSVLVGKDLIKAATVRAQITQLQQVETAINTFRSKYAALPGDMPNATQMFGSVDASGYTIANGNGDGLIISSSRATVGNCVSGDATEFLWSAVPNEVEEVFHHLNLAGLGNYNIAPPATYAGSGLTNLPTAVFGGGMLVSCLTSPTAGVPAPFQNGTGIAIGNAGGATGINWYSTRIQYVLGFAGEGPYLSITPDMALALDSKMDDGLPQTGSVGVFESCTGNSVPATYGALITSNCNVSMVKMLWQTN